VKIITLKITCGLEKIVILDFNFFWLSLSME